MQAFLIQLGYKVLSSLSAFLYEKYLKSKSDSNQEEFKAKRKALRQAIRESKNDEQIKQLSTIMRDIDKLY